MAKLYVFGIGGTGSRVLRSFMMLLAVVLNIDKDGNNPITEVIPVIIDPDRQNGDLTRTVSLMNDYKNIHKNLKFTKESKNRFFKIEISSVLQNFTLLIKDTDDKKFKDFMDYSMLSKENKSLVDMLFSERNLDSSMDVGFKGNPNIGSVVLNQVPMSDDFTTVMNNFQNGDKIFIISSVFGGTGASGFPLLLKTLRTNKTMPNFANINNALIGAVTVLPYFGVKTDDNSEIESSTFISKAKAAMGYYEKNIIGNGDINALYYLADEQKNSYDNHEGMSDQQNDAHLIELLAATAIVDFCNNGELMSGQTNNYELGLKDGVDTVTFKSFYNGLADMLRQNMTQFVIMANAFLDEFDYLKSNRLTANTKLKLNENFYSTQFIRNLRKFFDLYRGWLNEMKQNKRSLNLFNLECGNRPFSVVTDVTYKKSHNPFKKIFKEYEFIYEELNSAAKKISSDSEENDLLEMFYRATEKLVNNKFNF